MRVPALCLGTLLLFGAASVRACPPLATPSELQQLAATDAIAVRNYAVLRWLKCGWPMAEPVLRQARDAMIQQASARDASSLRSLKSVEGMAVERFARDLLRWLDRDPAALATRHFIFAPADTTPAVVAQVMRMPVEPDLLRRNFDDGFDRFLAFLRERPLPGRSDVLVDIASIKHTVWRGDLDAARAHTDRLLADAMVSMFDQAGRTDRVMPLERMQQALAPPVAQSVVIADEDWVVDRSTPPVIATCAHSSVTRFSVAAVRARVLRVADPDAAIAELFSTGWREQLLDPDADHGELLAVLLRRRYGDDGVRQAWGDAIARLRIGEATPSLLLFGHWLPLPSRVREADLASPGGVRERAFTREDAVDFLHDSPLYRRSMGLEVVRARGE